MKTVIIILCTALLAGCAPGDHPEPAPSPFADTLLRHVYDCADRRDSAGLAAWLDAPQDYLVLAALQGFSAFGNRIPVARIGELATDKTAPDAVRVMAVYVLGQRASAECLAPLTAALHEDEDAVSAEAIASLARQLPGAPDPSIDAEARQALLETVIGLLLNTPTDSEVLRSALGRAGAHIHRSYSGDDRLLVRLVQEMRFARGDDRYLMANAMARYTGAWDPAEIDFVKRWLTSEKDHQVRSAIMTMLGRIGDEESVSLLRTYATNPAVPVMVRINALRALTLQKKQDPLFYVSLLSVADEGVLGELLMLMQEKRIRLHADSVLNRCGQHASSFIRAQALGVALADRPSLLGSVNAAVTSAPDDMEKAYFLRALGNCNDPRQLAGILLPFLTDATHPVTASAAADALVQCASQSPVACDCGSMIRETFAAGDPGAMSVLSGMLGDSQVRIVPEIKDLAFMREALNSLTLPRDIEAFNAIQQALNRLEGTSAPDRKPEYNHPIDWDYLSALGATPVVEISTAKGSFSIALEPMYSPGSVAAFCRWVEEGYYNNKPFHRVVNNFVIQTGCPRGDGWGSASFTLRSEFGLHHYRAGAVGLASAGTDTESCQWFVTHLPTPHLEGRYTIIGYVNEGMDVVARITPGDMVINARLVKEKYDSGLH